jgi:hypothetical protein
MGLVRSASSMAGNSGNAPWSRKQYRRTNGEDHLLQSTAVADFTPGEHQFPFQALHLSAIRVCATSGFNGFGELRPIRAK